MKRAVLGVLLLSMTVLAGCETGYSSASSSGFSSGPLYVASPLPVDGAVEGRPSPGRPRWVMGSSLGMVPFAMEKPRGYFEASSYGASGSYAEPAKSEWFKFTPRGTRWHNLLLIDRESGASRLLLDRRGLVLGVDIAATPMEPGPNATDDDPDLVPAGPPPFLMFTVVQQDTNDDGLLDENDASVVYLCDGEGGDLRQITPDGTKVRAWDFDDESHVLYFIVTSDTDQNQTFTSDDASKLYRLVLEDGGEASPFAVETFGRAEKLLQ